MNVITQTGLDMLKESAEKTLKIEGIEITASGPSSIRVALLSGGKLVGHKLNALYLSPEFFNSQVNSYRLHFTGEWADETNPIIEEAHRLSETSLEDLVQSRDELLATVERKQQEILELTARINKQDALLYEARMELSKIATTAIKAHESMFAQCCSNPVKNAWGKDVDVSAVNDIALAVSSLQQSCPGLLPTLTALQLAYLQENPPEGMHPEALIIYSSQIASGFSTYNVMVRPRPGEEPVLVEIPIQAIGVHRNV